MVERIREIAKRWLDDGEIDAFVGFRRRDDGSAVPARFAQGDDVDRIVFGDGCTHNLLGYVDLASDERVGLLLKGCDGRALVQLMVEGEIDRERVKVLGIVCPGLRVGGALEPKCEACRVNTPPVYDELVSGEGDEPWERRPELPELAELEGRPAEERARFFAEEFERCIRCYACRDICPLCYCEECVTEKSRPQWVEVGVKPSSNAYWNLIRAYHLAGRCVECGECDRACPVGIPLRLLNQRMAREAERLFGYVPGTDPEAAPVLLEFKEDEEHLLCPGEAQ
jgi:ferredoxin